MQQRTPHCQSAYDRSGTVAPSIWVILPTYCEAANIREVLERLHRCGLDLNVLVVDDNSPDDTGDIVEKLCRETVGLHLLRRPSKTSLGEAYVSGFEYALSRQADVIVTMDCDLSHDPSAIPCLTGQLNGNGCVVGSRYVPGGRIVNWPRRRLILSRAANSFVHGLFRTPIKDCTSGFRVYRAAVVEKILAAKLHSHGYSFQVEALMIAAGSGLGVVESPITFVERTNGSSKMGLREVVGGVISLTALWLKPHRQPKLEAIENETF